MQVLTGTFTVPLDISEARVREAEPRYIRLFLDRMEKDGWMLRSDIDVTGPTMEGDRKCYHIRAWFKRRPRETVLDVQDNLVARLLKKYPSAKLLE